MFCVNCQKPIEPETVTGADIYGSRFAFASSLFCVVPGAGIMANVPQKANRHMPSSPIPGYEKDITLSMAFWIFCGCRRK